MSYVQIYKVFFKIKNLPNRKDEIEKKKEEFINEIKNQLNLSQLTTLNNLINKNLINNYKIIDIEN